MDDVMRLVVLGGTPIVAFLLLMGAVIGWDRYREPRRSIFRPIAVVDPRTYRNARVQIDRLVAAGEWGHAYAGAVSVCTWLSYERHCGRPERRVRLTADLADWQARREEYSPLALARTIR